MTTITARSFLAAVAFLALGAGAASAAKIDILTEAPAPAAEAPAEGATVVIDKMKYQTPEITIKAGDTVTWVNAEAMPHNVAFKAGVVDEAKLDGAMLKKDQSYTIRFNEAGTYDYHCTPHPFMKAKVIVE